VKCREEARCPREDTIAEGIKSGEHEPKKGADAAVTLAEAGTQGSKGMGPAVGDAANPSIVKENPCPWVS
jgi:hypothetical protein